MYRLRVLGLALLGILARQKGFCWRIASNCLHAPRKCWVLGLLSTPVLHSANSLAVFGECHVQILESIFYLFVRFCDRLDQFTKPL
jgi:hypothetical protein